jgi:hypothetical protein
MNDESVITRTPNLSGYNTSANTSNGNSSTGIMSWLIWFFFNRYMLIVIILAYLGINILSSFGAVIKVIVDIFRPLLAILGYTIGETSKEAVKLVKTGSTEVIDVAAGTLTGGINVLEKGLTGKYSKDSMDGKKKDKKPKTSSSSSFPIPDEAGSKTQASKANSKAGYCYIGEDRGFRSCIQVNDTDTCMSGDIFPTQEICINPSLRQ